MNLLEKMMKRIFSSTYGKLKLIKRDISDQKKILHKNEQLLENQEKELQLLDKKIDIHQQILFEVREYLALQNKLINDMQDILNDVYKSKKEILRLGDTLSQNADEIKKMTDSILNLNYNMKKTLNEKNEKEILWSNIFNSTVTDSEWLEKKAFSFGRWAIGYPCAYVLYRILDELQPKAILELGLGQSTKITGQYAARYRNVKHYVVEHDVNWISFFAKNFELSDNTKIIERPLAFGTYNGINNIREYDRFNEVIDKQKFELILIDAPLGGDMPDFARIDVLRNIPSCLKDSFIIILDDCNRSGESNTFKEMMQQLKKNGIKYKVGYYEGQKTTGILCSEDYGFITTM